MYKTVFLNANVLVDVYDLTRPAHHYSQQAVHSLLANDETLVFTSCDIITTIYYLFAKVDREKAMRLIEEINGWCGVVEFGNTEIGECLTLMKNDANYKDLEDTIQYVMAKKAGCDLILSNDRGFVSADIALMSTEQFFTERA